MNRLTINFEEKVLKPLGIIWFEKDDLLESGYYKLIFNEYIKISENELIGIILNGIVKHINVNMGQYKYGKKEFYITIPDQLPFCGVTLYEAVEKLIKKIWV